jgi:RimJ/RimL family protein N-acetyltransferase
LASKVYLQDTTREDAEILSQISKKAFDTDYLVGAPSKIGGPPGYDSPQFQLHMMKSLTYKKIIFNEKTVGGVAYNSKKKGIFILERIFINPDFHNQGIASKVMDILFNEYPKVVWTLDTPEWNLRTKNFYEKHGFRQVGWEEMDGEWRCRWYQRDVEGVNIIQNIGDLNDGMSEVVVIGKITRIFPSRKVKRKKDGKELTVTNAILEDETGRIKLTLWNDQIKLINLNEKRRIEFGRVTSYNDELQLNLGFYGRIIKID